MFRSSWQPAEATIIEAISEKNNPKMMTAKFVYANVLVGLAMLNGRVEDPGAEGGEGGSDSADPKPRSPGSARSWHRSCCP